MNFKRFFTFKGRINRTDYICTLCYLIISVALFGMYAFVSNNIILWAIFSSYFLAFIIIPVFITVQRLYDIGRPGTDFMLILIPLYNIYIFFILLIKKGITGLNEYGDDPVEKMKEAA